ncbi:transglutaminase domain-containing protein [Paenibacillus thailandensis]|uniref:Transglutaminase domain-containing protein n=1 Tax=Paenibacillus thailandensis TaxID=393250 RepID=A0ABW5QT20_9BACL
MDGVAALNRLEPVSVIVLLLLIGSLMQGIGRGASGSARRFFFFIWDAVMLVVCLVLAGKLAEWLSPAAADWLAKRVTVPDRELGSLEQVWYTMLTSVRDFALLRFGALFLLAYLLLRLAANVLLEPLVRPLLFRREEGGSRGASEALPFPGGRAASRVAGALIGALHGAGRAFVFMALLFVYVSLLPSGPFADRIAASPLYRQTASWLEPAAGKAIAGQGPVLAKAVQDELYKVLDRKYEIIDYNIPADIEGAALQITADAETDREKARALYDWVGSRISYDWEKADRYVQLGEWKEQTPQETYEMRTGVCIDYARLYAMMARSAGLTVRVVTGLGADGNGGYGPHAWNEVKLDGEWTPLDATWASSGDWFDAPRFEETHIREV